MSDNILVSSERPRLKWARSATRHRVAKRRSRHVIEHSGIRFQDPPAAGRPDERFVYAGDDADGVPLEVIAVELETDELLVIHAMPLRKRYRARYEEARRWRRP